MNEKKISNYNRRNYMVIPYNKGWEKLFKKEAQKIKKIFPNIPIEHIGSTSVKGMVGKPCIDFLVIPENLSIVKKNIAEIEKLGYLYAGEYVMKEALLFRKMKDSVVLANVHFFPKKHPHVKEILMVRDYLRSHKEEVKAYSLLKKKLYKKYPNDYASYRKEKDLYMVDLLKRVNK